MEDWHSKGCEHCRRGVLSAGWPPPTRVAASADGPAFLHRCELCGSYWMFDLREAHVIGEEEARREFPEAFGEG